jgi:hypothetical protein
MCVVVWHSKTFGVDLGVSLLESWVDCFVFQWEVRNPFVSILKCEKGKPVNWFMFGRLVRRESHDCCNHSRFLISICCSHREWFDGD